LQSGNGERIFVPHFYTEQELQVRNGLACGYHNIYVGLQNGPKKKNYHRN